MFNRGVKGSERKNQRRRDQTNRSIKPNETKRSSPLVATQAPEAIDSGEQLNSSPLHSLMN
jgi:hypothetical protein